MVTLRETCARDSVKVTLGHPNLVTSLYINDKQNDTDWVRGRGGGGHTENKMCLINVIIFLFISNQLN